MLIPRGTELTEANIANLGRRVITGLYAGDDWPNEPADAPPEAPAAARLALSDSADDVGQASSAPTGVAGATAPAATGGVNVATLRVGTRLAHDIYDQEGVLLLAAGSQITSRFMLLLRQRNIRVVRLHASAGAEQGTGEDGQRTSQLDELLAADLKRQAIGFPLHQSRQRPHLPLDALWAEGRRGLERHVTTSALLTDVCESLRGGGRVSGEQMRSVMSDFVDSLTLDFGLLATVVSMQRTLGEYLFDHCVNVALLSMTIGAQMGLSRDRILTLGLGAVFQDVGMLRVPAEIRLAPRGLTAEEWAEIERHPIHTLDFLERIRNIPDEARFVGYQTHERADGSGYPRQRSATSTHPFAKIVAVADVYCAMTRPRPHRSAILPHDAVKTMLGDGGRGRLDRTILRAFLDTISAFPIGSLVELSDGTLAKVVRANLRVHTRPIVVRISPAGEHIGHAVDLLTENGLKIVRASPLTNSAAEPAPA